MGECVNNALGWAREHECSKCIDIFRIRSSRLIFIVVVVVDEEANVRGDVGGRGQELFDELGATIRDRQALNVRVANGVAKAKLHLSSSSASMCG